MIKLSYKIVDINEYTWAVVIPCLNQPFTYFVSERFGMTIAVINAIALKTVEFPSNGSFAEILKTGRGKIPSEVLAIICKEYIKRNIHHRETR